MNLPAYPKTKKSSVEWLGNIPEHWDVVSLKRKFRLINGSTPKSSIPEFWGDEIIWVTPADLSSLPANTVSDSSRRITLEGLDSCGTSLVPKGSIVISCRAPIGAVALAGQELCTNQGCKTLVMDAGNVCEEYFYYCLSVSKETLNAFGCGSTFMELASDTLGIYRVCFPPFSEQRSIAEFLDRKTGRIDELIGKKKELIEKLNEQRSALITAAVTGKSDVKKWTSTDEQGRGL